MSFRVLLRSTVLLSNGTATALALLVVLRGIADDDPQLTVICAIWWLVATLIGTTSAGGDEANPQVARALADARPAESFPEQRPVRTLLNRLWPLLTVAIGSGAFIVVVPQVTGVAVGFFLLWALLLRRQDLAVQAIEERDGVEFHVLRTGLVSPLKLVRLPGLRKNRPEHKRQSVGA
ncbi:MAG: hypothetical protein M0P31_05015 [Solirubrobacteraceae bacterium]|nr:hypothetical protein [Solirubrobacteraceae bacterium]